jgi:UDP-glucose 4-epimerase
MSKKILITGGLGYVGSAITELYRGEEDVELILLDKEFKPHVVTNLPDNAKFILGNIKNMDLMKEIIDDLDILYFMAAEVEAEKSLSKEKVTWENNYEAPKRLFEEIPDSTRIMFPSTGNVFGGVDEDGKYMHINEEDEPQPRYPYAETKAAMEKYIRNNKENYTICRLGTNRGMSPGVRFNLVTNIFILNTILEKPITVHGEGDNYRPTVSTKDASRAFKFLSTKEEARGKIFHVVERSYQIKELAEDVVKYSGKEIPIEHIAKDVPFNSYHLVGEKITELGFEYKWPLKRDVEVMMKAFGNIAPLPNA